MSVVSEIIQLSKPIIFQEFGVESQIFAYRKVGEKILGLKDFKPMTTQGKIYFNSDDYLNEITEIKFFSLETGQELARSAVKLDINERVSAVIIINNTLLAIHRLKKGREYYIFPGGHVREQESIETALIREIKEEIGLDLVPNSIKYFTEFQGLNFALEKFYFSQINAVQERELLQTNKFHSKEMIYTQDQIFQPEFVPLSKVKTMTNFYPEEVVLRLASRT